MKTMITNPLKSLGLAGVAGLAMLSLTTSALAGEPSYEKDYKAAVSKAKEAGKPVVVIFSASWCPPCQVNKKDVYPSKAVEPYVDKFVWVYLDVDKDENKKLAEQYGVRGIPHIEFLSPDAKKLGNVVGGTTPEDFAASLKTMLAQSP
ncbi:thioredoxin family protein [Persicirhabdus sediminis]|uniref:Thioredoxin family protein n=2 Tax=Persicirhabdus sediminis TaxID=454144 RepID=A0A8J7ME88_9BACT|nr:thioredoxin family protein [Persicirhabdus sediminis]